MGRIDQIEGDWHASVAALAWQMDLGIDCLMLDAPVNRYEEQDVAPAVARARAPAAFIPDRPAVAVDHVAEAERAAAQAETLADLRAALEAWPHCEARRGARNMIFAGGAEGARVMVVGDVPDIDEDRQGLPFAAAKGALFDAMFAAIGLSRGADDPALGVYVTTALPWRTVGEALPADLAMLRPFLRRHIELARPEIVVAMGRDAIAVLGADLRGRGHWGAVADRPVLAMQHPADLLRNPALKADAWADLMALRARLKLGEKP